jgi:GNAT superfamily N-acetyltransferase
VLAVLRQATRADIPAMHRIRLAVRENRLTSSVITEENYVPAIEITGPGWVIALNGEIVAFAVGNAATGNVWALFVDPPYEGRGYGRRLLEAMVSWLFARGLAKLYLSTGPNTRAARFYHAAGWQFRRILDNGEALYELDNPSSP